VEKLEEFDGFAAAMAIPDQGLDPAGKQVDAGAAARESQRAQKFGVFATGI
jgi:hypothetical protein